MLKCYQLTPLKIKSTPPGGGQGILRELGEWTSSLPSATTCSMAQIYSLLFADENPKAIVQFAKLVDHVAQDRYRGADTISVESHRKFSCVVKRKAHAGPANEGKVDGTFLEYRQVVEGCHLAQRLPRTVERRHAFADSTTRNNTSDKIAHKLRMSWALDLTAADANG